VESSCREKILSLYGSAHKGRKKVSKVRTQPLEFIPIHQQVPVPVGGLGGNDGARQSGRKQM